MEGYPQSIVQKATQRGVETTTELHLNRYLPARETVEDLVRIGRTVRNGGIGLIHCHLTHDHGLGGWASFVLKRRIPVIRTNHKGVPIRPTVGNRWLLNHWTDGLVEYSQQALQGDSMRFGIPRHKILRVYPAVDFKRFDSRYVTRDVRRELGVERQEVLVGVVARMQRHRRFDVLLKAMALMNETDPPIRLMVLGRGTHRHEVAMAPAKRMGLATRVLFPGYRSEDYVEYLGALDVKVMLVPGSDGTCRALREAMAMGKPAVVARRGMLPEIVEHGVTGFVIDDTPESLSEALLSLAQNPQLRIKMGEEARKAAMRRFDPKRQASQVGAFYEAVLASGCAGKAGRFGSG
jgi:glycosyltransferase involved in cell wall biosynthesis